MRRVTVIVLLALVGATVADNLDKNTEKSSGKPTSEQTPSSVGELATTNMATSTAKDLGRSSTTVLPSYGTPTSTTSQKPLAASIESSNKMGAEAEKPQSKPEPSSEDEMDMTILMTSTATGSEMQPTTALEKAKTSQGASLMEDSKQGAESLKTDSTLGIGFYSGVVPFGFTGYAAYPYYRSYPYYRPYWGEPSYRSSYYPWYHRHYNPWYRYI